MRVLESLDEGTPASPRGGRPRVVQDGQGCALSDTLREAAARDLADELIVDPLDRPVLRQEAEPIGGEHEAGRSTPNRGRIERSCRGRQTDHAHDPNILLIASDGQITDPAALIVRHLRDCANGGMILARHSATRNGGSRVTRPAPAPRPRPGLGLRGRCLQRQRHRHRQHGGGPHRGGCGRCRGACRAHRHRCADPGRVRRWARGRRHQHRRRSAATSTEQISTLDPNGRLPRVLPLRAAQRHRGGRHGQGRLHGHRRRRWPGWHWPTAGAPIE